MTHACLKKFCSSCGSLSLTIDWKKVQADLNAGDIKQELIDTYSNKASTFDGQGQHSGVEYHGEEVHNSKREYLGHTT